jgi:hypothetical protein
MVSAHTPHWFHKLVANRVRGLKEEEHDPWPTYYRINNPAVVRRQLQEAGFAEIAIELIEPYPVYLVFNPLAFRLGIAYERLVNRWAWSSRFRLILIARAAAGKPVHAGTEHGDAAP